MKADAAKSLAYDGVMQSIIFYAGAALAEIAGCFAFGLGFVWRSRRSGSCRIAAPCSVRLRRLADDVRTVYPDSAGL